MSLVFLVKEISDTWYGTCCPCGTVLGIVIISANNEFILLKGNAQTFGMLIKINQSLVQGSLPLQSILILSQPGDISFFPRMAGKISECLRRKRA